MLTMRPWFWVRADPGPRWRFDLQKARSGLQKNPFRLAQQLSCGACLCGAVGSRKLRLSVLDGDHSLVTGIIVIVMLLEFLCVCERVRVCVLATTTYLRDGGRVPARCLCRFPVSAVCKVAWPGAGFAGDCCRYNT